VLTYQRTPIGIRVLGRVPFIGYAAFYTSLI
jgi:hypothetical protein